MIVKKIVKSELCIGVASSNGAYEVVAMEGGKATVTMKFPATNKGTDAIKSFLAGCGKSVRMAVSGTGSVSLALALNDVFNGETLIVSSRIINQALPLARYAGRTV